MIKNTNIKVKNNGKEKNKPINNNIIRKIHLFNNF